MRCFLAAPPCADIRFRRPTNHAARSTHVRRVKLRRERVRKSLSEPLSVRALMKDQAGKARTARVAVRLTRDEQREIEAATVAKGYANSSAFIRAAIRNELHGHSELTGADEKIGAGFDRVSKDIFRLGRGQQAMFALLDTFAKAVLACVPEPPPDARPQAIARAKERYDRLVKSAGQSMSGDARSAMEDLLSHAGN